MPSCGCADRLHGRSSDDERDGWRPRRWVRPQARDSRSGNEVLDPLGRSVTAMGQKAMVGHSDAHVDREEVHDGEGGEVLPGEEEEAAMAPTWKAPMAMEVIQLMRPC